MQGGLGLGLRGWGGLIQRTARALSRRYAVASGRAGRRPTPVATFWWDSQSNFGDQLNVDVLLGLGVAPVWAPAPAADLIPIGSLLEHLPADFHGAVWGSGMIFDQEARFPGANILAVRGHRTWDNIGRPDGVVLGDPGLLARQTYGAKERIPDGPVVLVPHLTHRRLPLVSELKKRLGAGLVVVDVTAPPARVVSLIGAASAVISTSLHGLIVADSYGIPAAWWHPEPALTGGRFKFHDYESALGGMESRERVISARTSAKELREMCVVADRSRVDSTARDLTGALLAHVATRPSLSRLGAAVSR